MSSRGNSQASLNDGFTLSETLITLVIIGIVAAMTVSGLIVQYRKQALENQFKKSYMTVSQIILKSKMDLGVNRFLKYCQETKTSSTANQECTNAILKQINAISKFNTVDRSNEVIKTYNSKNIFKSFDVETDPIVHTKVLLDGSFLGFRGLQHNTYFFGVDINGYSKPNKFGHDIFLFSISTDDRVTNYRNSIPNNNLSDDDAANKWGERKGYYSEGTPCNLESNRESNGLGCTYFAIKNVCPYDETKTYFECLP